MQRIGARTPASDNVWEVITADVDVLPVDKGAIADISVAAPNLTVLLVRSDDHVAISCDSNNVIPVVRCISGSLTLIGISLGSCEFTSVADATVGVCT